MRKIWRIKDSNPAAQDSISSELNISKITAQLLLNRGIGDSRTAAEFMTCSLASCHDPFLLKDMRKAVSRIKDAVSKDENMLVYGDYDVDGMTGVATLYSALL